MIYKYDYFITEKLLEEIFESKFFFSKKFINILNRMKDNKIAKTILYLYSKDIDITQNYIDVTDKKDTVSFTPDRKAKDLIKDKPETWSVKVAGRYLTKSSKNDNIFKALGYDKEKYDCWSPDLGTVGIILAETISKSGNIYVMFKEYEGEKIGVVNKESIEPIEESDSKVWSTSRNNIKIGRLARALLSSANLNVSDAELEQFINLYKSTYDFLSNVLVQFDIVKGSDISYWYSEENYLEGGGSLNNSCMADVDSDFFDIYCYNPQVSLVILYTDNGSIKDGKYKDDKIKGRAILWDCKIDGVDAKFMDRIYTTYDNDVELFKQYAEKNGWWYKKTQSMEPSEAITDGKVKKEAIIEVKLDDANWDYYPYCDTICYINSDTGTACNTHWDESDRLLRSSEGGWEDPDYGT